jgi:glycine betaine/proline transport system substrate-binding protein
MRTMRYLLVLGLIALMTMVLAACGEDDPTATPTPRPAAEPTAAPDDSMMEEKPTLVFADLNWSSAVLQNWVARVILEEGYGYETDAVAGGTLPLMQALVGGDLNVNMEIWLPNQQEAWDKAVADGTVEGIGDSLSSVAWQSAFLIPKYTADANPGLTSVDDLKSPEYQALFARSGTGGKAALITCIPGWECEIRNNQQVIGYGLADHVELVNPGSFEGLNSEILSAFERGEDILFYYWGPTALIGTLVSEYGGYVRLEEPASTPECEEHIGATHDNPEDTEFACEYADAQVVIAMRTDLMEKAPDVVDFFKAYELSDDGIFSLLGRYADTGEDAVDVAKYWLRTSDEWQDWVSSDVADTVLNALGGPIAMEDTMMEDKPAYWELFVRPDSEGKAGLVTCIPGWECEVVNEKQVHGYGLDEVITLINPGSYEGLNAEILGAFEKGENILFYYWGPETLPAKLTNEYGGFVRLEEPAYSAECWDHMSSVDEAEDITQACEYSDADVLIAVRTELLESAPDVVAFLEKWTLSDEAVNALLGRLDETGDDYEDVAAWWMQQSQEWTGWVSPEALGRMAQFADGTPVEVDSSKPTLIFSDLNWSTALLQNALARIIIEAGYGYPTDSVAGGTIPLMQALTAGDTNVTMEIWLPNQQAAWSEAEAAGTVTQIGDSLASVAWQSAFLIPQYVADANPGLQSVEDLLKPQQ